MGKKPPLPPWIEHAAEVRKKLKSRGFKPADRVQICESCEEQAEEAWTLRGGPGMGGRDIVYCMNCGRSRSWRGQGTTRAVEEPFDLIGFLGLRA
ncbi:MAG TPA: hypothetical protein VG496_05640 [Myxococcales bacterium]|nr:hypothetical protein [Myxococcales bacterium]